MSGRYRIIHTRIWQDEQFLQLNPDEKLVWLCLLTHPLMTPMGAGVLPASLIDEVALGKYRNGAGEGIGEGSAERILERLEKRSMVIQDNHLVIVKNFLVYNRPDNPNQLASWIASCEELPRSEAFRTLYEHLSERLQGKPEWLFAGLLKPLADKDNRDLRRRFDERIRRRPHSPNQRSREGSGERSREPSEKPSPKPGTGTGSEEHKNSPPPPSQREGGESDEQAESKEPDANTGRRAQGRRRKKHDYSETCAWDNAGFDRFWAAWRNKQDKLDTRKAWDELRPAPALVELIIADVKQRNAGEWRDKEAKFLGYPAKYLRRRRWEDGAPTADTGPPPLWSNGRIQPTPAKPPAQERREQIRKFQQLREEAGKTAS